MWLRRGCGVCQGVHAADWGGCGWEGVVVYVRGYMQLTGVGVVGKGLWCMSGGTCS